jgi:hypothetical protein
MVGFQPKHFYYQLITDSKIANTHKPVKHLMVSFHNNDYKKLTEQQQSDLLTETLERLGYGNSKYFAVEHNDTKTKHFHICVSRLDQSTELVVCDKNEHIKRRLISEDIERRHNLTFTGTNLQPESVQRKIADRNVRFNNRNFREENKIKSKIWRRRQKDPNHPEIPILKKELNDLRGQTSINVPSDEIQVSDPISRRRQNAEIREKMKPVKEAISECSSKTNSLMQFMQQMRDRGYQVLLNLTRAKDKINGGSIVVDGSIYKMSKIDRKSTIDKLNLQYDLSNKSEKEYYEDNTIWGYREKLTHGTEDELLDEEKEIESALNEPEPEDLDDIFADIYQDQPSQNLDFDLDEEEEISEEEAKKYFADNDHLTTVNQERRKYTQEELAQKSREYGFDNQSEPTKSYRRSKENELEDEEESSFNLSK